MKYDELIPFNHNLERFLQRMYNASLLGVSVAALTSLANAYVNGFNGCFIDVADAPDWMRKVARFASDSFVRNCQCGVNAEDVMTGDAVGAGKGKRAVHFQWIMQVDPTCLMGSQDFGNCVAWASREIISCCIGTDIKEGRLHEYTKRPGTAVTYGGRGTSQQGMALSDAANIIHTQGISLEIAYPGFDLSTEDKDEQAGNKWGRSGVPKELLELVKGAVVDQVSKVTQEQAVLDILHAGHFINTGSVRTAKGNGDPVSAVGPVGGHSQALIGYDDTDEFRAWYEKTTGKKLNDWVGIFDQSWGPNWVTVTNWPDHLWGPRPEGAFVLRGQDAMQLVASWGEAFAFSTVKGFPVRKLPDWGTGEYL